MAFTVRDVIIEALARSTLVSRRQPAPGVMMENGYRLLKGIAADYSNHNLLQFLRREINLSQAVIQKSQVMLSDSYTLNENFWFIINGNTGVLPDPRTAQARSMAWDNDRTVWLRQAGPNQIIWDVHNYSTRDEAIAYLEGAGVVSGTIPGGMQPTLILGTLDKEIKNDWVNVPVENVADIKEVYWDRTNDPVANAAVPLQFVSFEDFKNSAYGDYIYTWQHVSDTKIELKLKPRFLQQAQGQSKNIVMAYNVKYNFDLDSVLKIPDIYQELFVTALTYKLSVEFPRLSPEHTERLKADLKELENSLKTTTRANKFITRTPYTGNNLCMPSQLISGSFIFPN